MGIVWFAASISGKGVCSRWIRIVAENITPPRHAAVTLTILRASNFLRNSVVHDAGMSSTGTRCFSWYRGFSRSSRARHSRRAHPNWRPEAVASAGALPPFPHCTAGTACPAGIVQLDVECIRHQSGGMDFYYGYEGYFHSVLVQFPNGYVFDARGEQAK